MSRERVLMGNSQRWRTLTPEQKVAHEAAIASAYQDSTQTTISIIKGHHISQDMLLAIVDEHGIPHRATGLVYHLIDEDALIRDYLDGVSLADIVSQYKIGDGRMRRILKRCNIPKRVRIVRRKGVAGSLRCAICGILLSEMPSHGRSCDACWAEYPIRAKMAEGS